MPASMSSNPSTQTGRIKKTLNACQRCRTRKIKCSGQHPCRYCASKKLQCVFSERPKMVTISEEYLNQLESRSFTAQHPSLSSVDASQPQGQASAYSGAELQHSSANARQARGSESSDIVAMPLTFGDYTERRHSASGVPDTAASSSTATATLPRTTLRQNMDHGHDPTDSQNALGDEYRRFGHSSSWAFSRYIRTVIRDAMNGPELHDAIPIRDGAYGVPWQHKAVDFAGLDLPVLDYAEYLTHTVSFAFSPLYHLFDKEKFLSKLRDFYSRPKATRYQNPSLWHIQMLSVFGLGKSILARDAGPSGPTGSLYFARAVEALPDGHQLSEEPVLGIEILIAFSLFMQTMDMRFAAYQYIGQAGRIAIVNGFNRRFDRNRLSLEEFQHRSKLWWTIYVIDRKLSGLIGVAPALPDMDNEIEMPSIDSPSESESAMGFHVEISSQLGQILNVVYGPGFRRQLGKMFVSEIQAILKRQADMSTKLNSSLKVELHGPAANISRTAATLLLLYHQCSILAIRPMLYFLLRKKLAADSRSLVLSDAVVGLLNVCIESALQVLKIMETLELHKLFDCLLTHDFDIMFAAAFVLLIVEIATPAIVRPWDLGRIFALLDEFKARGNIIAGPYKQDLIELNNLRQKLNKDKEQQSPQWQGGSSITSNGLAPAFALVGQEAPLDPRLEQDLVWTRAINDGELGPLRPEILFSAIDDLNFDLYNTPSDGGMDLWEWMN